MVLYEFNCALMNVNAIHNSNSSIVYQMHVMVGVEQIIYLVKHLYEPLVDWFFILPL